MQPSKPKAAAPTTQPMVPWNKGAFVGPKPPLKPKHVNQLGNGTRVWSAPLAVDSFKLLF